ncbi:hypothetical protein Tco_0832851, partial [Tanacetum coccineum]
IDFVYDICYEVITGSYTSSVSYTTTSSSADASGNVLENVLHSFVAESDPQQQITYEDFDQIGNTKSGSWDQFGTPLAIALICLCDGKKYNWSRYIFTGMVNNINNSKKFLMFPRPIPTSPSAQVNQKGPSSNPHVESSLKDNDSNPDPNVADDPLGGSFFASPSRSKSNARFDKWKESSKNLVKLINSSMFSRSKFGLGYGDTFGSDEVKFGNDQVAPILGYGDLVQGAITIKRVYYVEGLNHNLFSVGQFCDADLEVVYQKSSCYIRDLKGNDLLTGSCGTDLYSITLQDSTTPNLFCLMAKAS